MNVHIVTLGDCRLLSCHVCCVAFKPLLTHAPIAPPLAGPCLARPQPPILQRRIALRSVLAMPPSSFVHSTCSHSAGTHVSMPCPPPAGIHQQRAPRFVQRPAAAGPLRRLQPSARCPRPRPQPRQGTRPARLAPFWWFFSIDVCIAPLARCSLAVDCLRSCILPVASVTVRAPPGWLCRCGLLSSAA